MSEEFENIIRKKLQEAEPSFDPAAWEQMKAKLDNADRRRPFFWWWWAGGLLLVAGLAGWWWFTRPADTTPAKQEQTAAATDVNKSEQNPTTNTTANGNNKIQVSPSANIPGVKTDDVDNPAGKNRQHSIAQDQTFGKPAGAGNSSVQLTRNNVGAGNNVNKPVTGNATDKNISSPGSNVNNTITAGSPSNASSGGNVNNTPATSQQPSPVPANVNNPAGNPLPGTIPSTPADVNNPAQKPQPASDSASADKPVSKKQKRGFDGGLFLGPDLNVTPAFKGLPIGVTGGLIVRYHVNNRWYLNTGVGYAKKLYGASPSEYTMSYPNAYYKIDADCDVIDVPLNLNYTFAEGKKSSWSVMAGASSYFMLNEKYTGTYNNGTKRDWIIKNKNEHYFSVINLGVTWEKQTRSRLTWGLQPYVKIPVSGVGQGSVRVYSAGVTVQAILGKKKD